MNNSKKPFRAYTQPSTQNVEQREALVAEAVAVYGGKPEDWEFIDMEDDDGVWKTFIVRNL
jgi:hypothetical protein